jgi:hypothetical protein
MDYITIPVGTQYTLPTKMYINLMAISEEIPQIVKLSRLRTYFPKKMEDEQAFGYASIIIENILDIKKSYFTVIDYDTYAARYKKQKIKLKYSKTKKGNDSEEAATTTETTTETTVETVAKPETVKQNMAIHVANEDYLNELMEVYGDKDKTMEYLEEEYKKEGYVSNLNVNLKIGYVESYVKSDPHYFHYWGIPSKKGRDGYFKIDSVTAKKFIKSLKKNQETYDSEQFDGSGKKVKQNISKLTKGTLDKDKDKDKDKDSEKKNKKKKDTEKEDTGDTEETLSSKDFDIIVLNATGVSGVAANTEARLEEDGLHVGEVGDYTGGTLTQTKIVVKEDGMGEDLKEYFTDAVIETGSPAKDYDIEIDVGTNDSAQ